MRPATGAATFDPHARSDNGSWIFVDNGRPEKPDGIAAEFEFTGGGNAGCECLLDVPLCNGTESLDIGVPPGSGLRYPKPRRNSSSKPIVGHGTSIAQARALLPAVREALDRPD